MKKLILTVAILANGLSAIAFSNSVLPIESINIFEIQDFTEVSIEVLPEVIANAVKKDYANATLMKAYINSKGQYKLELKIEQILDIVYVDKEGNWIEEKEVTGAINE